MDDDIKKILNSEIEAHSEGIAEGSESAENAAVKDAEDAEKAVQTEASAVITAADEAGLSPAHIGHLLKVLGDDIIGDMLESAGLTPEDLDAMLEEAQADEGLAGEAAASAEDAAGGDAEGAAAADGEGKKGKRPGPRRKGKAIRRLLFVLIFIGIIGLVAAVNKIYNSVTINTDAPIQYSEQTDEISAEEGLLKVNNVSVVVPTDGTETYSISYSWAEDDDKYPSVPHAITAIYSAKAEDSAESSPEDAGSAEDNESADNEAAEKSDSSEDSASDTASEEGGKLYSISLYRNETTPSKEIEKGKKTGNWFDDWTVVNDGGVLQTPLKSGSINGFYVFPKPPEDEGAVSDYNDFSYYFAVKDKDGISTYVIEGVCLDPERDAEFRTIMDNCIHSIKIKKAEKDKESDNESDNEEPDTDQP